MRLTRWTSCTVSVVFRPYTKLCGHELDVRRRLVEFPPRTAVLGDLDHCIRKFTQFDERDRDREELHFTYSNLACYIWRDSKLHAQIRPGMHPVGVRAAEVQHYLGNIWWGCVLL